MFSHGKRHPYASTPPESSDQDWQTDAIYGFVMMFILFFLILVIFRLTNLSQHPERHSQEVTADDEDNEWMFRARRSEDGAW